MAYQTVFKRYELKYMITKEQKKKILRAMEPYMRLDKYGRTTIRNIYFDTADYRLIRRSIEKPAYKEKLRIRSYEKASKDSTVFVELKKKYNHVVYKRRLPLTEGEAISWLSGAHHLAGETQVSREIDYFLQYYGGLHPTALLSYEREAYYAKDDDSFRVTFDDNILFREEDISLETDVGGISILPDDMILMEIKCVGGIPIWMTEVLSKEHVYRTSFSKYGTAYKNIIFPRLKGDKRNA